MNTPKRISVVQSPPDLGFDVTQEIDPSFVDLLEHQPEATLSPVDFIDVDIKTLKPSPRGDRS